MSLGHVFWGMPEILIYGPSSNPGTLNPGGSPVVSSVHRSGQVGPAVAISRSLLPPQSAHDQCQEVHHLAETCAATTAIRSIGLQ